MASGSQSRVSVSLGGNDQGQICDCSWLGNEDEMDEQTGKFIVDTLPALKVATKWKSFQFNDYNHEHNRH